MLAKKILKTSIAVAGINSAVIPMTLLSSCSKKVSFIDVLEYQEKPDYKPGIIPLAADLNYQAAAECWNKGVKIEKSLKPEVEMGYSLKKQYQNKGYSSVGFYCREYAFPKGDNKGALTANYGIKLQKENVCDLTLEAETALFPLGFGYYKSGSENIWNVGIDPSRVPKPEENKEKNDSETVRYTFKLSGWKMINSKKVEFSGKEHSYLSTSKTAWNTFLDPQTDEEKTGIELGLDTIKIKDAQYLKNCTYVE